MVKRLFSLMRANMAAASAATAPEAGPAADIAQGVGDPARQGVDVAAQQGHGEQRDHADQPDDHRVLAGGGAGMEGFALDPYAKIHVALA